MNKLFLFVLFTIHFISFPDLIKAQVRIGADKPPEDFAILQIDGVAQGLRLPRLSEDGKISLVLDANAAGLMIYNAATNNIEYYDGTTWRAIGKEMSFGNGLTLDGGTNTVSLGGSLTENTEIDMKTFQLSLPLNGGSFSVNTNDLHVNNDTIIADVNSFSIIPSSNEIFKVNKNGAGNKVTISTDKLQINTTALQAFNDTVSITGTLAYKDGSQAAGHVLTSSDTSGNAYWAPISASTSSSPFTVISTLEGTSETNPGTNSSRYLSTSAFTAVTNTKTLTPGKWFITGTLYTYTYNIATNSNANYSTMIRIYDTVNSETLFLTGEQPEAKAASTSNNGGAYAAIPLKQILIVPEGQTLTIRIDVQPQTSNTFLTKDVAWLHGTLNSTQGSMFQAVRVND